MRSKKSFLLIAAITLLMVVSGQVLAGRIISLNLSENSGNQIFTGGQLIGPLATDSAKWNTTDTRASGTLANGTKNNLIDNAGVDTGASVTWSCGGTYWNNDNTGDDEHKMSVGYLDDGGAGVKVNFSGVPFARYRVYGMFSSDTNQGTTTGVAGCRDINVNGTWVFGGAAAINVNAYGTITNNKKFNGTWWTKIVPGTVIGNYWTTETTGASLAIACQVRSGSNRGSLTAVIVEEIDSFLAYSPVPANNATLVALTQVLSWSQYPEVNGKNVTYKVYMGTDPNTGVQPLVKTTTAAPADYMFDPTPDMPFITKYYWRVDALEPNLAGSGTITHTGPLWAFTTQPADAQILTNPVSQTVAAGANAQFTIGGLNITKYQWYKDGVALTANAARYTGQNTGTLTVLDVQVDDEGFYTCQADNTLNKPATSTAAQLITRRLAGWWKLDGDLTDSVASVYTGAAVHNGTSVDPKFAAVGKDGGAADLPGVVNSLITFPDSANFFNFYPRGYTVSAWVNMPAKDNSPWGAYVTNQDANPNRGFILTHDGSGTAVHTLRQSWNDMFANNATYKYVPVDDNSWHMVTGTYDAATGIGMVFIDGSPKNQATNTTVVSTSTANLLFGAERVTGDFAYIGQLDDVRIYSYPLAAVQVASLYIDFTPGAEVCSGNPVFDIAGSGGVGAAYKDCIVNLYDMIPVMTAWLECNIVPTCR